LKLGVLLDRFMLDRDVVTTLGQRRETTMTLRTLFTTALLLVAAASVAHAQAVSDGPRTPPTPGVATTPGALVEMILERLVAGTAEAFDSIHPDEDARRLVRAAREQGIPLRAGAGRVLAVEGERAVVLLSAHAEFTNSGDETILARAFSDLFEAYRAAGGWRLGDRVPMDAGNRILAHSIGVEVQPGVGLVVRDTMEVEVGSRYGFRARLNHRARIDGVTVDGREASSVFGGGLLWIDIPATGAGGAGGGAGGAVGAGPAAGPGARRATVVLDYRLDVARDSAASANSGRFEADYGHVRNQYFWHPFFDFNSEGDRAFFRITARAPTGFRVVTSVPQTDTGVDGVRVVRGRSDRPTFALTLMYDREWEVATRDLPGLRVEIFATPEFRPSAAELAAAVGRAYRVLSDRFGEPSSGYVAAVQGRARTASGWHFRSNDLIVGGSERGPISRGGGLARAWLGHEVAHGWTEPTGPAANLLSEGWAMYAESLILADEYGPDAATALWEGFRNVYMSRGFEGTASVMHDPNNAGVSYYKGAWILRMLEHRIGTSAFQAGFRAYMSIPPGRPAGIEEFVAAMSEAAGSDVAPFLRPWLEEKVIPDVRARMEEGRVVLVQEGPGFTLTLDLELETAGGLVRRRVELAGRETVLDTRDLGPVVGVRIDPDRHYLIRRHRGEVVRFELDAAAAADAGTVLLHGDFLREPLPAALVDGAWVVEIPMSEGQYAYWWSVGGTHRAADGNGIRWVVGTAELPGAYPR
jgi:hypothetical protein